MLRYSPPLSIIYGPFLYRGMYFNFKFSLFRRWQIGNYWLMEEFCTYHFIFTIPSMKYLVIGENWYVSKHLTQIYLHKERIINTIIIMTGLLNCTLFSENTFLKTNLIILTYWNNNTSMQHKIVHKLSQNNIKVIVRTLSPVLKPTFWSSSRLLYRIFYRSRMKNR